MATIDVGVNPFGDAMAPDGNTLWVANSGTFSEPGATVTVIDANTFGIESVIPVGGFPEDITFARAGSQAFVTNSTDAAVSVIDAVSRTVTQTVDLAAVPMEFPFGIIATQDSQKLFVTSVAGQRDTSLKNVAVLDNSDPTNVLVAGGIDIVGGTGRPALTPDGRLMVLPFNTGAEAPPGVAFVNPDTNEILEELMLPTVGVAPAATVTPDGQFAYVNVFCITGCPGEVWVVDLATRSTVTVIPTPDPSMHGVRASPDGRFVFATNFSLGQVSVINTDTNQIIANVPVGQNPNDIAFTPDGAKAFVTNQGDTTVSVISISE
ncbi:MAG TPA: hypothetical protein VE569_07030 [Acidimicrobiia bacterium]|nr:hypothetical protein [Acidimicrobiia bacterium]